VPTYELSAPIPLTKIVRLKRCGLAAVKKSEYGRAPVACACDAAIADSVTATDSKKRVRAKNIQVATVVFILMIISQ
jgi:hypothetical protein